MNENDSQSEGERAARKFAAEAERRGMRTETFSGRDAVVAEYLRKIEGVLASYWPLIDRLTAGFKHRIGPATAVNVELIARSLPMQLAIDVLSYVLVAFSMDREAKRSEQAKADEDARSAADKAQEN